MPFPSRPRRRLMSLMLVTLPATLPVLASAQEVGKASEKSEWLSLVIGVLLVAIVCVGAFMGSKRGHMD